VAQRTRPLLILATLITAACAPPVPFYDAEIGVEGVATDEGTLAGVFGHKVFAATLVQVPIPGIEDELGGGFQWLLLRREYDAREAVYRQTSELCAGLNVEVHGTVADVPSSTYRAVPPSTDELVTVDHATGALSEVGLVQLWGLRGLEDPAHDPLPVSLEEAKSAAFADKVWDMDGDDEPGYTTFVEGIVNGEAWGVLRRRSSYRGAVLGADRVFGLVETGYDSTIFGASDPSVEAVLDSAAPAFPDPGASWFEELRLPDDATCDDVVDLEDQGSFLSRNPF
jgi:hypothetical protein